MFASIRKADAYRVYLVRSALSSLAYAIIFTTWMIFQIELVGLDALQLVLVGTTLEVSAFLFEIPTGVVADVYSRRLSIIIGIFFIAAAFMLQGLFPTYSVILFAQVLWGLGFTFTSGASDAWIVDEIGEERAGKVFTRGSQIGNMLAIPGIIIGVLIASLDMALPTVVGGGLFFVLGVYLVLFMPENGFTPKPREERSTWQNMIGTFRDGLRVVRGSPTLLSILAIGLFVGLYSEAWDRLWQFHLIENIGLPVFSSILWIGAMDIVMSIVSIGATEVMRRRLDMTRQRSMARALFAITAVMIAGLLIYAATSNLIVAIVTVLIFTTARGLAGPVFATWSNQNISSDVRATVLSMQSQTDAIGQIAGGPPMGAIGQISARLAFVASAAVLSPTLVLLFRASRVSATPETPLEASALETPAAEPAVGD